LSVRTSWRKWRARIEEEGGDAIAVAGDVSDEDHPADVVLKPFPVPKD